MRTRRYFGALAALVALTLILAACGGESPTATTARPAATSAATIVATSAPTAPAAASPAAGTSGYGGEYGAEATSPAAASTPGTVGGPATSPAASAAGGEEKYTIVPESSKASYKVNETFIGRGFNTAVGSSNVISGDIYINRQLLSASRLDKMTVDISKLASDDRQRDNQIRQRWLESNKFPQAVFVTKRLEGLPDGAYTEGQELSFKIVGDLTIRTVTKEITWDAKGKIEGGVFKGTATTSFNMTDFGFDPPSIGGFVSAENGVTVEMELEAKKAP